MDDYQREITDLQAEVDRMQEDEEDPKEISELAMQLEILKALYERARDLYGAGADDPVLRDQLRLRGYGDWDFENVYAFVYETSVDLPGSGHQAFVGGIRQSDFAGMLTEPGN